ncbi:hypothetical protein B0H10DRAFT_1955499 [Mycena sp. CBHHK59/15]|nr:hypothetical protein B0H10DRAFT_1955499 [Mycena sp. CBHHK59/15]
MYYIEIIYPDPTSVKAKVAAAILAPPSALDKPGTLYVFDIPADQPNCCMRRALAWAQIRMAKIGRSKHPWKHWAQWLWKCWGQRQDWWAYWNVLYAAKFAKYDLAKVPGNYLPLPRGADPPPLQTPGGMDVTFGMPLLWHPSYRKIWLSRLWGSGWNCCLGWPVDEVAM